MGRRLSITVTVLAIILVIGAALGCGGGPSIASLDVAAARPAATRT